MTTSPLLQIRPEDLQVAFQTDTARLGDRPLTERKLSDLRGSFHDAAAYEAALAAGDPLLYSVASVEPASGDGQLHYGLGILYPGKIGDEYFLTRGHYHSHRPAAEVYIGLKGKGLMLLEDESTGESRTAPLGEGAIVYVPGHTAHRTMNTGSEPLVYIGVYPSNAGHDYGAIAKKNFRMVVVEREGRPVMLPRP
jgi:glucose-6-phosphate isomerase, archaeal